MIWLLNQLSKRLHELLELAGKLSVSQDDLRSLEAQVNRLREQTLQKAVQIGIEIGRKAKQLIQKELTDENLPEIRKLLRDAGHRLADDESIEKLAEKERELTAEKKRKI
jgi:hypothetical protein